jgi:hypothetical protein
MNIAYENFYRDDIIKKLKMEEYPILLENDIKILNDYLITWTFKYLNFYKKYLTTNAFMATINIISKDSVFKEYLMSSIININDLVKQYADVRTKSEYLMLTYIIEHVAVDSSLVYTICTNERISSDVHTDYIVLARILEIICEALIQIASKLSFTNQELPAHTYFLKAIEIFEILIF